MVVDSDDPLKVERDRVAFHLDTPELLTNLIFSDDADDVDFAAVNVVQSADRTKTPEEATVVDHIATVRSKATQVVGK